MRQLLTMTEHHTRTKFPALNSTAFGMARDMGMAMSLFVSDRLVRPPVLRSMGVVVCHHRETR